MVLCLVTLTDVVSEMTYTVLSGTLNSTIPYHTIPWLTCKRVARVCQHQLNFLLDYLYKLWHLLSALYSDVRKIFLYRCISTFSALNYCRGFFKNPSAIYAKWCAQTLSADFLNFHNFYSHFSEIVAPSSDENGNHVLRLKVWSLLKKVKPHQNRPLNRHTILVLVRSMSPSNKLALRPRSVTDRKTKKLENKSIVPCRTMHTGRILSHEYSLRRWS